jgi:lipoprotein-anchoring transpeptidase ErfK/SrfK
MKRREFIKNSLMGLGALAITPYQLGEITGIGMNAVARIATDAVSVYTQPWDKSKIVYTHHRDELVNLYGQVVSAQGPAWNPVWYRVWRGYIHSKALQIVENRPDPTIDKVREGGQLAEITVPYVQSMRYADALPMNPLYRLYYGSVHWVIQVVLGLDGKPWYRVVEPWSKLTYDVPAEALRLIADDELNPISPDVPPEKKRIEVSIIKQLLTAYESNKVVFQTKISSGLDREVPPGAIPWTTPGGEWRITSKMPTQHMGNGNITSEVQAYELAGVPWVCYFHVNGNATHGTYWHTNFGNQMSHGCVNMPTADARWIFRWTTPVWSPNTREMRGNGTELTVL